MAAREGNPNNATRPVGSRDIVPPGRVRAAKSVTDAERSTGRSTSGGLRREPFDPPSLVGPRVLQPVVQPARAALPELDGLRDYPVAAPEVR